MNADTLKFLIQSCLRLPLIIIVGLVISHSYGQKVIIDGSTLTIPRITESERNSISPEEGMLIYNTTKRTFQGYGLNVFGYSNFVEQDHRSLGVNPLILYGEGELLSIELYYDGEPQEGSIKILDQHPCGLPDALAISSTETCGGWTIYTFDPPFQLLKGKEYILQTNSGIVNANTSNAIGGSMLFVDPPRCNYVQEIYAVKTYILEWVDLH